MANLFLEIPRTKDEEEFRRLLDDRMLTIGEELIRLGKKKPLEITEDIDMQGHRILNLGDPEKVRVSGKQAALLGAKAGETAQQEHAVNVQFGDARWLRRRVQDEGAGGAADIYERLSWNLCLGAGQTSKDGDYYNIVLHTAGVPVRAYAVAKQNVAGPITVDILKRKPAPDLATFETIFSGTKLIIPDLATGPVTQDQFAASALVAAQNDVYWAKVLTAPGANNVSVYLLLRVTTA